MVNGALGSQTDGALPARSAARRNSREVCKGRDREAAGNVATPLKTPATAGLSHIVVRANGLNAAMLTWSDLS